MEVGKVGAKRLQKHLSSNWCCKVSWLRFVHATVTASTLIVNESPVSLFSVQFLLLSTGRPLQSTSMNMNKNELSTTDIILIVVFSVLFVVFVIIAVVYLVHKKIKSRQINVEHLENELTPEPQPDPQPSDPPVTIVRTVEDALRDLESDRDRVRLRVTYHL